MNVREKAWTNAGLQMRLSVFVTSSVLIVSAIVLLVTALIFKNAYYREIDDRISDSISSTTNVIEQMMLRIEYATNTMALVAPSYIGNGAETDYVPGGIAGSMPDVHAVSFVRAQDLGDAVAEAGWTDPYEDAEGDRIVSYQTPVKGADGKLVGAVRTSVMIGHLTSLVTRYKARKDVDVSIYSDDGEMIVAPDDYIYELSPEDMIVQERTIDHLGWKLVFSADKKIIDGKIHKAIRVLALIILILFADIIIVIVLSVRYIVKPFVKAKEQTEKEKAAMAREMQIAADTQRELVPHVFPPFPGCPALDIYACLHPARVVGGDLYDYFIQDGKLHFCIGDVSGKGVPASLLMSATHYLFRSTSSEMPLCEAVSRMNRSLSADNAQCTFVTFWAGCLDIRSGELEYVNAGHNGPVIVRNGCAKFSERAENMPLGVLEDAVFVSRSVSLSKGDAILLYTDGVTEAMDAGGREFGEDRTLSTVAALCDADACGIISGLLEAVKNHAGGAPQNDDITMLCLKMNGD